jgi:nitrite reductase (NO-forming)
LLLFHAHVNLLGWVTLTVLGTLLTLWPTTLHTRIVDGAARATRRALPLALAGLAIIAVGTLAWWPLVAATGLAVFAAAVIVVAVPAIATARQRTPASFATWSIAAGMGWLLIGLAADAATLVRAPDAATAADRFGALVVPLGAGFVAQVLLGALSFLLAVVLGGGPVAVRERMARLDAHWAVRVTMTNLALVAYVAPVPPYVRIATSMVVFVALITFVVLALRVLLAGRTLPGPLRGVAVGTAVVLVAVGIGFAVPRFAGGGSEAAASASGPVVPTGHTTTVAVSADAMRYHPDHISVPAGDRLVIVLTNTDSRRHDLVLATGAHTPLLTQGDAANLDAGVIGGPVEGWCSQPMHRQSGMTLHITTTAAPVDHTSDAMPMDHSSHVDAMADPGPGFTARDASLPPASADRIHRVTLHAQEVQRDIAPGVNQTLWTFGGTAPGPTLRGHIGDEFEVTLVNDTHVEHGIDFHAEALAPDVAMRTVEPGQSIVYRFTATRSGIWMYHCSAMPMLFHIGNGMYGAVIIDPPDLAPVDHEYVLVQSEFYLGAAGQPGDLAKMRAGTPDAITFNGYVSQYAARPLTARAGQRVRIWVLDAGPNRSAAFHLVGAPLDTVYAEGAYRLRPTDPGGAQVLDLAPASGGFVEAVLPGPGSYPFLTHAMADADLGARGLIQVSP